MGILEGVAAFLSRIILIFAVISFFIAIIDLFVSENISLLFLNVIGLLMGFFLQIARVLNFFPYLVGDFSEIPRFLENMILFFLIIGGLFLEITTEFIIAFLFLPLDLFFLAILEFYNSLNQIIPIIDEILKGTFIVADRIVILDVEVFAGGKIQVTPAAGEVLNILKGFARDIFGVLLDISSNFFVSAFGVSIETGGIEFMLRILAIDTGLSPTLNELGSALGASAATNLALSARQRDELEQIAREFAVDPIELADIAAKAAAVAAKQAEEAELAAIKAALQD